MKPKPRQLSLQQRLQYRLYAAHLTRPHLKNLVFTLGCLGLYGLLYLPIGLSQGFLEWQPESNPWQWFQTTIVAFVMPGFFEELIFRVILIPHPTEPIGPISRQRLILLSWLVFILYHLLPWTPTFFHQPNFLIGAGLLGFVCTLSYLQSRSIWMPIVLHWAIVSQWLLLWGGLEKIRSLI